MKRLAIIIAILCLALPVVAKPKAEIKSQWRGARVAYLGDSITDKRQVEKGLNDTYWVYLEKLLGTESLVYGISGHQWYKFCHGKCNRASNNRCKHHFEKRLPETFIKQFAVRAFL